MRLYEKLCFFFYLNKYHLCWEQLLPELSTINMNSVCQVHKYRKKNVLQFNISIFFFNFLFSCLFVCTDLYFMLGHEMNHNNVKMPHNGSNLKKKVYPTHPTSRFLTLDVLIEVPI